MRVYFQDESRMGLITEKPRRIGSKTLVGSGQYVFDYFWLYGLVEPKSGDLFLAELPGLNSDCFQVFIDEFSKENKSSHNLIFLDGATAHTAKKLKIPSNITLELIPAYSPELNPIERLWKDIKKHFSWENFDSIEKLSEKLTDVLKKHYSENETVKSLTLFDYIKDVV